jgi:PII-like signaling protein
MNGYQVTFFTQQDRRHGHVQMHEWLMQEAKALGIRGSTVLMAVEGYDQRGRLHSAHFFELADQPLEVTLAATSEQVDALFARLQQAQADVFYVRSTVEFGRLGAPDQSTDDPMGRSESRRW